MFMDRFFCFLQFAIGARDAFPSPLSDDEWHRMFTLCTEHALVGIGFSAVEKLHAQGVECPKELMMRWMALAMRIEQRNRQLDSACAEVTERLGKDGFATCVLKGQGNVAIYPEHLGMRRQPGDIDVWVRPEDGTDPVSRVIDYVRSKSVGRRMIRYHHADMELIPGVEIEVHYRVGFLCSPLRNMRMQRWFGAVADECMKNRTAGGFSMPVPSVNVVYQMMHIFGHYFDEGVGLRQLLDYYYVLGKWHASLMSGQHATQGMWDESLGSRTMTAGELMGVMRSFGMAKFAGAVMYVLRVVFSMPVEWMICGANEKAGRELLEEMMQSGNFGKYDRRSAEQKNAGVLSHGVWKLRRNMRFASAYPEEVLCEPVFRLWHWCWRVLHGSR